MGATSHDGASPAIAPHRPSREAHSSGGAERVVHLPGRVPAAAPTSFLPLTTSWNIVGSTSDESIVAQAAEAGTNFVPAARVSTNGFTNGSSAATRCRTSVKVGRKPIASNSSPCASFDASRFIRSTARVRCEVLLSTPMLLPPAKAGAIEPGRTPGSGTTAYSPFTSPASTAWRLKSPAIAMPALPEANAVTVSLPPMPAHLAAGQLSSPNRDVYASMPFCAAAPSMAEAYEPPLPVASSPPLAQMKGMAP